ncbi:MAG: SDR family NAD(P)-dependent oxidoreductase, partial [SAR202 cluster bacterium]|nr:SDR family NAD(P)-dependent oxidoreductase [SAR202 cluster bacterium]
MDLNGKVAVVTGAGRGIGRAIAEKLAEHGAKVVIADVGIDNAVNVAEAINDDGHEAEPIAVDVTRQSSVDRMARGAMARFGQLDILINNAGIIGARGWETRGRPNERDWDTVYAVNVKGVANATRAVSVLMRKRKYGKIINIASVAGRQGAPGNPPYNISKAGVISL